MGECRLLTCTFLHAGLLHLGLNCYALFSIGPDVEAVLGYRTFATIYLLSGLGGSIASFLFSDLVTVGASGAIFGLLGVHTALAPFENCTPASVSSSGCRSHPQC